MADETDVALKTLVSRLEALGLLPTPQDPQATPAAVKWTDPTATAQQVIQSGALAISKALTQRVAVLGGFSGLAVGVAGVVQAFIGKGGTPGEVIAFIIGGSVIIAATVLALAMFVSGDVRARAAASAAQFTGRAQVAAAVLGGEPSDPGPGAATAVPMATALLLTLAAYPRSTHVSIDGADHLISGVQVQDEGLEVRLDDGSWKAAADLLRFTGRQARSRSTT